MVSDAFEREITHFRISVTQKCNQSCLYCHHEGQSGGEVEMSPLEIARLVRVGRELGIKKLKLTGGEPLLREDILEIVKRCSDEVGDLSLTTNGTLLENLAMDLKESGLKRVNVSLDSLDPRVYERITGRNFLSQAIRGIEAAVEADLNPLKINMVVLKGLNNGELQAMLDFAENHGAVVQLIELEAPQESLSAPFFLKFHDEMDELESSLERRALTRKRRSSNHRTRYFLPQEVEVVRPMHNSEFCAHCHRLRITSNGMLKPCLLAKDGEQDVLAPMRNGASDAEIKDLFLKTIMTRRPYWS